MRDHGERIAGQSMRYSHGFTRADERLCRHYGGGDAQFFHDDAVEQTARTARPSIPDSGQNEVAFLGQHPGGVIFNCMGYGALFYGDDVFQRKTFG